jgi:quinohemoprotein ethanol dehydrogenase
MYSYRRILTFLAVGLLLSTFAIFGLQGKQVTDAALKNSGKTGDEWLTVGLNYAEQRYSPLKQIDTSNVSRLGLAWTYEMGNGGGNQEATPMFANGMVYGITNWSITFAVDARTGKEIWRYDPMVDHKIDIPGTPGTDRICCGVVSRGIAFYQNKVIIPVIDGRLEAVDATTGKLIWSVLTTPKNDIAYSLTMAPRIVKGKVIIGNAGAEFPPYRGYFSAFDANNGKELWRFYTVPGDPKKPFENPALEKAAKTWSGEWWKLGGGGSVWDGMAYDPDLNLLYVGTGNGTPWPTELRQGRGAKPLDNLYVASILAVDPDSGQLKWHYQATPGDIWDYDGVAHLILADIRINGAVRKVIMQANKNGFFYVIDRTNGQFISGEPFSKVSWASGIDPKTGRPNINPEAYYTAERGATVAPTGGGAHSWAQMAFNPTTGLVYMPIIADSTFNYTTDPNFKVTPGAMNLGLDLGALFGGPPAPGAPARPPNMVPKSIGPVRDPSLRAMLSAWDPATQKEKWTAPVGGASGGGVLSTAGNLVFQVTANGRLYAYSADKGQKLLDTALGQNSAGPPMTFMFENKQYIAVMAGHGLPDAPPFAPPPGTPAAAPPSGTPAVKPRLYVYVLDGKAPNPTPAP